MKNTQRIPILLASIFLSLTAFSQREIEEVAVPLSNPNKPGTLIVDIKKGHINVSSYEGEVVLVQIKPFQKEEEKKSAPAGLKRIPNQSMDVDIQEADNKVIVETGNWNKRIDFFIQVPKKFDLILETYNSGVINVDNIEGEINAESYNGPIFLKRIAGSASASTYNGEIEVHFVRVNGNTPMAFSTYNGDIKGMFPENLRATAKIKSQRGEILTDFDMEVQKAQPNVDNRNNEGGVYKIEIDNWVIGQINGGGPEFLFKNYNGDVIIQKEK